MRDDFPLWSGRYDRELPDALAIQDEISRGIVNSLHLKLGRGRRRYEVNAEAYDLYLRVRGQVIQRGLPGVDASVGPFEEVIAKDPSFAPAYAGVAVAHVSRSGEFKYDLAEELSKMRSPAQKAVELDPLLAEAHDALGMVYARDAQWEQSEKSFRRAIELDPNRSTSYDNFALYLLLPLGRIEEALKQLRVAEKADPLSPEVHYFLYYVLNSAGRYDEADGYCDKLPTDYWAKEAAWSRRSYAMGGSTKPSKASKQNSIGASRRALPFGALLAARMRRPAAARGRRKLQPRVCPTHSIKPRSSPVRATRTALSKLWIAPSRLGLSDGPGAHVSRIRPAPRRSAAESSSQEGWLAGIILSRIHGVPKEISKGYHFRAIVLGNRHLRYPRQRILKV